MAPRRRVTLGTLLAALTTLVAPACGGTGTVAKSVNKEDYDDVIQLEIAYSSTVPELTEFGTALMNTNIGEEWGLDLEVIPFSSSTEMISALASGSVDLYWASDGAVGGAVQRGIELTVVGESAGWIQGVAVPENSDIQDLADLAGKKVGTHEGTTPDVYLRDMVEQAGVKPADVNWVNVPITEQIAVMEAGGVEAVVSWAPTLLQIRDSRTIYRESVGPGLQFPGSVLAVPAELAKENEEAVVRLLAALIQSNWWVVENQEISDQWYVQETGSDQDLLTTMLEASPLWHYDGLEDVDYRVSEDHIEQMNLTAQLFAEAQGLSGEVDYNEVVDNSFFDEAKERVLDRQDEINVVVDVQ